jgi:hypothetical protein
MYNRQLSPHQVVVDGWETDRDYSLSIVYIAKSNTAGHRRWWLEELRQADEGE